VALAEQGFKVAGEGCGGWTGVEGRDEDDRRDVQCGDGGGCGMDGWMGEGRRGVG
jgi:hypothetical protein